MNETLRRVALAATFCALLATPTAIAGDLVLIFDASGSMWGQIEGENKIVIARRVLGELVDGLGDDERVGLVAYGHRREGDCADIETVAPLGQLDKAALKRTVEGLNPKGKTPITASIKEALKMAGGETSTTMILISDGLETCGGDPCAAVRTAKDSGLDMVLHVVGFDVAGEDTSQLECAAQAGGGLFSSAENATELGSALEAAVAMPADVPAGRLSVKAITNGELQDVAIRITHAETGEEMDGGRTYAAPETNPRLIPLADGRYDIQITAVGLKGDIERRFEGIEIAGGGIVEKVVDFSTGELVVGTTRNGALSDATVRIYVAGTSNQVAASRTYRSEKTNPKTFELTAGTYDVGIGGIEIAGKPEHRFEGTLVEPRGRAELSHEFASGEVKIGVVRGTELIDAIVKLHDSTSGKEIDSARTYNHAKSNPKTFVVPPGSYTVEVGEVKSKSGKRSIEIEVAKGEAVEETVDLAAGG